MENFFSNIKTEKKYPIGNNTTQSGKNLSFSGGIASNRYRNQGNYHGYHQLPQNYAPHFDLKKILVQIRSMQSERSIFQQKKNLAR